MDFSNRGNKPAAQPTQPAAAPQAQKETGGAKMPRSGSDSKLTPSKLSHLLVVFGVAILAAAVVAALVFGGNTEQSDESDLINTDRYQAVFLDSQDGQVYFGKLAIYNSDLYVLNDIYYVRVENPIQPQGEEPQAPNISLAKLGNELHGPEDVMFIARDKVLYWENLKDEGQVVQAITDFKANGSQPTQPQTQQQTQPVGTTQQDDTAGTEAPAAP